ncbi:MAG: hypothetical protein K8R73_04150 [Clostridiales bacterium]|nr:hypothetical protein [Clostridiales bacterium]
MKELFEISGLNIYMQIVVTIISITVHLYLTRNKRRIESTTEIIAIYTIGLSGWFGMISGIMGHIIYADQVAQSIGWPINSGFQMELAFAAFGIGLIGFMGFWIRSFWLPYIITRSTFLWGAGITHILHMIENQNFSPSNTGIVVYWDFILPIILIALYLKVANERKQSGI